VTKDHKFFLLNPPWIGLDQVCSRFLICHLVSETYEVKLKICPKLHQFLRFLPSQIFGVWAPQNLYISDHAHHMARHMAKFRFLTPFALEVIGADMLNFKPILEPPLKKIVRGSSIPSGGLLARLGHSLAQCVKIWGCSTL